MTSIKNKNSINIWIVEQYYHGDSLTQSWGKPLKVCYSEKDAIETCELEAKLYIDEIDNPYVDRSIPKMITVRPSKNFCPSMDFWYYHSILVEDEEN